MFFHPRDTGGSGGLGAHENDSEGCRVEILKNGSYWGKILRIGTVAHKNYYYNYNPTLVNGSHPAVYVCEKKHAVYGTNKAKGYDCLYLDIITCRIFPGSEGTGVGYWYAGRGAEIPSNQNDRDVSYELINMESTLWPRRFNSVTFRNCGLFVSGYYNWDEEAQICGALCSEFGSKFRGDNHSSLATRCNAAAPWAYPFELSGFGAWFIDPLMYHCYKHCDGTGEQYVFNPYLGYVINCPASCD